jgi:hypothetical protein
LIFKYTIPMYMISLRIITYIVSCAWWDAISVNIYNIRIILLSYMMTLTAMLSIRLELITYTFSCSKVILIFLILFIRTWWTLC